MESIQQSVKQLGQYLNDKFYCFKLLEATVKSCSGVQQYWCQSNQNSTAPTTTNYLSSSSSHQIDYTPTITNNPYHYQPPKKTWMNFLAKCIIMCTILLSVFAIVFYSYDLYRHGSQQHLIGWFSSAGFVLLTVPISIRLIVKHLTHYNAPHIQKYVVRIIWMVPLYAVESWLALRFISAALYIETLRECYEAYVIYSFLYFLIALLGDEQLIVLKLKSKSNIYGQHYWPVKYCIQPWVMGYDLLFKCKVGVLQYVFIKNLMAILVCILDSYGVYKEGEFRFDKGYLYICIINNMSQMWALYCLIMFYSATKEELSPWRPVGKFLCVKLVVFFTWWQNIVISVLGSFTPLLNSTGSWSGAQISKGLQDYLICIEMFVASLAFTVAFTYTDYQTQNHSNMHFSSVNSTGGGSSSVKRRPSNAGMGDKESQEAEPFLSAFFQSAVPHDMFAEFDRIARGPGFLYRMFSTDDNVAGTSGSSNVEYTYLPHASRTLIEDNDDFIGPTTDNINNVDVGANRTTTDNTTGSVHHPHTRCSTSSRSYDSDDAIDMKNRFELDFAEECNHEHLLHHQHQHQHQHLRLRQQLNNSKGDIHSVIASNYESAGDIIDLENNMNNSMNSNNEEVPLHPHHSTISTIPTTTNAATAYVNKTAISSTTNSASGSNKPNNDSEAHRLALIHRQLELESDDVIRIDIDLNIDDDFEPEIDTSASPSSPDATKKNTNSTYNNAYADNNINTGDLPHSNNHKTADKSRQNTPTSVNSSTHALHLSHRYNDADKALRELPDSVSASVDHSNGPTTAKSSDTTTASSNVVAKTGSDVGTAANEQDGDNTKHLVNDETIATRNNSNTNTDISSPNKSNGTTTAITTISDNNKNAVNNEESTLSNQLTLWFKYASSIGASTSNDNSMNSNLKGVNLTINN